MIRRIVQDSIFLTNLLLNDGDDREQSETDLLESYYTLTPNIKNYKNIFKLYDKIYDFTFEDLQTLLLDLKYLQSKRVIQVLIIMKHRDKTYKFFERVIDPYSLQTYKTIKLESDMLLTMLKYNINDSIDEIYAKFSPNDILDIIIKGDNLEAFMYMEKRDVHRNENEKKYISESLAKGAVKIFDYFVKKGLKMTTEQLIIVYLEGEYESFKYFMENGFNVNQIPKQYLERYYGYGTIKRNYFILEYLFENGSEITNEKNEILFAVCEGRIFPGEEYKVAKLMLKYGADPNYHKNGYTILNPFTKNVIWVLEVAIQTLNLNVIELLFEYGVNHPDEYLLKEAIKTGNSKIVEALLQYGVHFLHDLDEALSAHYFAISRGQLPMLKLIIEYSDVKELLINECLPMACLCKNAEIVLYLLEQGADVNYSNALTIKTTDEIKEYLTIFSQENNSF